jgi:hypothetical protein
MKHVIAINALTKPEGNFWMNPAYRIPIGNFRSGIASSARKPPANKPITEKVVNSLITSHRQRRQVKAGKVAISGMAWDGG